MANAVRIALGTASIPNSWFKWIASTPAEAAAMQAQQTAASLARG